nr:ribonuclease H-like domain-containing protein [Tanacetum cinerariifolium]
MMNESVRSQILAMDPLSTVNKAYYMFQQIEKQKQVTSHSFDTSAFFANTDNTGQQCFKRIGYPDWYKGKTAKKNARIVAHVNTSFDEMISGDTPFDLGSKNEIGMGQNRNVDQRSLQALAKPDWLKDFVTPKSTTGTTAFCSTQPQYPLFRKEDFVNYPSSYIAFLANVFAQTKRHSYKQSMTNQGWVEAMKKELEALERNNTREFTTLPASHKPITSKWVYKIKYNPDDTIERTSGHVISSFDVIVLEISIPSTIPTALLFTSSSTWRLRLGHPGDEVLRSLACRQFILHLVLSFSDLQVMPLVLDFTTTVVTLPYSFFVWDLRFLIYVSMWMTLFLQLPLHTYYRLFLSQKQYAIELLARAHMTNCNPSRTPVDTDSKLGPEGVPVQDPLYVAVLQRQQTISRSSAEAEYRGVANVVAETAWLRNLLRELHSSLSAATLVYCVNVSATYLSANPVQHQQTKHSEIGIHFVRDLVTAGQVRVLHVPSRYQYADIFTKGLPSASFEDFRSSLSVRLPPA